jgi:hypothetical protein
MLVGSPAKDDRHANLPVLLIARRHNKGPLLCSCSSMDLMLVAVLADTLDFGAEFNSRPVENALAHVLD